MFFSLRFNLTCQSFENFVLWYNNGMAHLKRKIYLFGNSTFIRLFYYTASNDPEKSTSSWEHHARLDGILTQLTFSEVFQTFAE